MWELTARAVVLSFPSRLPDPQVSASVDVVQLLVELTPFADAGFRIAKKEKEKKEGKKSKANLNVQKLVLVALWSLVNSRITTSQVFFLSSSHSCVL